MTLGISWITVCVGLLVTVWLCGIIADLGFSTTGVCELTIWLVIGMSILVISELGVEIKLELDTTEFELTEKLETWLELLELTIDELELNDSTLDIWVCEFRLVELKMIALLDKTKIEVIIARMILSLFDIEWC